eukprot:4831330-Pyramimonas_sp.AAC.1
MNKLETLEHCDSQSPLPVDLGKCRNIDVTKLPAEGWDRPNMDVVVLDDLNAICTDLPRPGDRTRRLAIGAAAATAQHRPTEFDATAQSSARDVSIGSTKRLHQRLSFQC